jgi:adenylate cyclase class IV
VSASGKGVQDELEVKARILHVPALQHALRLAGARLEFRGTMIDRRYDRDHRLEAVDQVLRLRTYRPARGRGWGVLTWKGPVSTRGAYRHRAELETEVPDPAAVARVLEALGFSVTLQIDRRIELWRLGRGRGKQGATMRIERYPEMDTLLEVEGAPQAIERAVRATGLPREQFLAESLPYFQAEYERRTGRPAVLSRPAR